MQTNKKHILFYLILLLIPVLFFLVLEGGLRLFGYGRDLSLFQAIPTPVGYYRINPDLGKRYIADEGTRLLTSNDLMLVEKPENGIRIFVLGGSSTAGYPYLQNGAFSRMLRDRLHDTSDRPVEVINLAMPAVNSFTLLDLVDELIDYRPDALLIYAGHNEFYGALGISSTAGFSQNRLLVNLMLKIQHFRLIQLLRDIITGIQALSVSADDPLKADRQTLMQRLVREQKIPYRSQRYQQALKIYRDNLREIVDLAGDNQIPLFFGELVSNLADQPPFISLEDEQAEKRLKKKVKNLNQLQLQTLLQQDSTLAMLYYHSGVHFEKEGRYAEAHQHYLRAKDLDLLRFRASEDFNQVLHNLSKAQHVYLVPLLTTYRQQSPHGLIGDSLMTDHLHPTIRGNQLIAAAFYQALQSKMDQFALDSSRLSTETNYFERSGVTLLDQWVANFRITVLTKGWPFVEQSQIAAFVDGFQPENYLQTTGFTLWKDEINWLEAHLNMALHYEKSGALEAALEEYAAISKAFPFDEEMLNQQGRLLIALGRINDARSILETSHSKKPTNFAARMLGAILTQQRDLPTGIGYLKIAVDLNPRDVQSLYNLAGAYYMSGAYNQALDMLDKLLSIDPGNQEAKVLLQQVKTRAGVE